MSLALLELFNSEVLIAIIGGISTIFVAWLGNRKAKTVEQELDAVRIEMQTETSALGSFGGLMLRFGQVRAEFMSLCDNSEVDRIVILCAWNGKYSPKWTTAVWQFLEGDEMPINYIHLGLDKHYMDMLNTVRSQQFYKFQTKYAPPCLLRDIYEAEGVEESFVLPLSEVQAKTGGVLVTYISFATRDKPLTDNTLMKCKLLAARLSPITKEFEIKPA